MPTKNPRLTITIEPSLSAQLRRLSALTGNSQSALIAEILAGSGPVFERLIVVLEAAQQAKGQLSAAVVPELEQAQQRVENQLGLAIGEFEAVTRPILQEAEKIKRRAARQGAASPEAIAVPEGRSAKGRPPYLTGGSGQTQKQGKIQRRQRVSSC